MSNRARIIRLTTELFFAEPRIANQVDHIVGDTVTFAAVVSNAAYTAAAQQLARTNGVYLLHHEELRRATWGLHFMAGTVASPA